MEFEEGSFDVTIDKGTLDAVLVYSTLIIYNFSVVNHHLLMLKK